MVYGMGINDMKRGWTTSSELNKRIYNCWKRMLCRCYCKKNLERNPCYNDCYVCERWLTLSNFVEDISKIDNYEMWLENPNKRISLDKDIKSNGKNKCYCLNECIFVTHYENTKQANKTRDWSNVSGKNNYNYNKGIPVVQIDKNGSVIRIFEGGTHQAERETGIGYIGIIMCCNYYKNPIDFKKKYGKARKTAGGFVWKYKTDK